MKRIDLIGAPGVGKSTLYKDIIKNFYDPAKCIDEYSAIKFSLYKYYHNKGVISWSVFLRFMPDIKVVRRVINSKSMPIGKEFEDYVNEYYNFIDIVNNFYCNSDKDNYRKIYGYHWMIKTLINWSFYDRWLDHYTILSDESLSQKFIGVIPSLDNYEKELKEYFFNYPVPNGLINLYNSPYHIVEQIKKRKKNEDYLIPAHKNKNDSDILSYTKKVLTIFNNISSTLSNMGVEVINIDMSKDRSIILSKIKDFINKV